MRRSTSRPLGEQEPPVGRRGAASHAGHDASGRAVALGAAAFAVAGFLIVGGPLLRVAVLGLALVFATRAAGDFAFLGLFKSVRGTELARYDAALYTPLCSLLGLALFLVVLS